MQLVLDCREAALVPLLPGAVVKQLTLGDVSIEKDGVEIALVERKTVADLAASIKDGRYAEQSARLQECAVPNHNIIYLIEGSMRGNLPLPRRTLLASLVSLNYGKGFSVVRTESLEQTAEFVQVLLDKLQKENGYATGGAPTTAPLPKKEKRDGITPENIDRLMLCQIPFVSAATADAVLAQHKTVHDVVEALRADETCLDRLVLASNRKVSSKSVASLKRFLLR
jgi:ERCC4-type nuclease